ncbi:WD repeat-containing protein 67 [Papilio machaon]|uniref:TBC1 domain family member 31 n=1 Tax=Papilio machaon TaxID=76193 RepID=A0A0N1I815_PAPMA|nr:WD repeat-containing protein 67 [Papilio machaon]
MENGSHFDGDKIEKFDIKIKKKPKDGVILQLHHTVRDSHGDCRRIRFSLAVFDDNQEKLACTDNAGNIFIIDFCDLKFWKLVNHGICTALHFVPDRLDALVVASSDKFDLNFLDTETGCVYLKLSGHTDHVKHISFSKTKLNNLLTASHAEAILWELKNFTKYFTLNTHVGSQIQQIMFTPAGDHLVACFQNDTVQIWRHDTMKSVKQIIPTGLKHIKNIEFTMNGRAMVIAGLVPKLILFSMDTWKAVKSIDLTKYNIKGVQHVAFVPQMFDGGANKILAILSSNCTLHLLDLDTQELITNICPQSSSIKKFVVSPTGKYFLCILHLGEVNIYNSSLVIENSKDVMVAPEKKELPGCSTHAYQCNVQQTLANKSAVEQKMRACMDSARLRRILMQYGEYPDKFRSIIWKSLLITPKNKVAYSALVDKGIHPAYKNIEKQFTIHSTVTLKNLKRLLSCLAHWCPLFGVMKFLPGFVFPFVKVLQKDPLLLFECVATILMNQCQLWFEYAPFPPISVLAMIENVLAEHDQQLLDHYCQLGVTSQIYALKILETAFSEVLTCTEWLVLWDHILSNEPAYILMIVVSYNIVQKNAIRRLKTVDQIEKFFHLQNPINMKVFLKKAYVFLNDTSEDVHPRRFFNSFVSLEKGGCYQQFTGYPKATICLKLARERKKAVSADRYTLRELTKKSQEKIINEGIKKLDIDFDKDNDKDVKDEYYKKHRRKSTVHLQNKDESRSRVREEFLKNVFFTSDLGLKISKETAESMRTRRFRESIRPKKKRKTPEKIHSLEKEVEKLIKSCSNSDTSD